MKKVWIGEVTHPDITIAVDWDIKHQTKLTKKQKQCCVSFIKLPFVIKIFILSIFEWPFYTGFTVLYVLLHRSGKPFDSW